MQSWFLNKDIFQCRNKMFSIENCRWQRRACNFSQHGCLVQRFSPSLLGNLVFEFLLLPLLRRVSGEAEPPEGLERPFSWQEMHHAQVLSLSMWYADTRRDRIESGEALKEARTGKQARLLWHSYPVIISRIVKWSFFEITNVKKLSFSWNKYDLISIVTQKETCQLLFASIFLQHNVSKCSDLTSLINCCYDKRRRSRSTSNGKTEVARSPQLGAGTTELDPGILGAALARIKASHEWYLLPLKIERGRACEKQGTNYRAWSKLSLRAKLDFIHLLDQWNKAVSELLRPSQIFCMSSFSHDSAKIPAQSAIAKLVSRLPQH